MASAEWYLKIKETDQDWVKIEIDPTVVSGQKGQFGHTLCFPYKLSGPSRSTRVILRLISIEGWIGASGESEFVGRIRIPSQIISRNPNKPWLLVPLTDAQIEAIEEARKGNAISLTFWLAGLATVTPSSSDPKILVELQAEGVGSLMPVESSYSSVLTIGREHWLTVLQGLGAGTRRLVELPEARLPRGMDVWDECLRLLDEGTRFYQTGDYEHLLVNCRKIAEGIPQILCDVWGLPQKTRHQSVAQWLQTVESRLINAWPEDSKSPVMLRTLLTGAWEWAAPAPHYGTDIPLREKGAFALEFCTSLLHFAGQVLQAHPNPIVPPAPAVTTSGASATGSSPVGQSGS